MHRFFYRFGVYDYVRVQGALDVGNFIYTFSTTNKTSQFDLIGKIIDVQYQMGSLLNFATLPLAASTQAAKLSVSHFVDVACDGICGGMASSFKETTSKLIEAVPKILAIKDAGKVAQVTASNVTWLMKNSGMSFAEASLTVSKMILKQAASNKNPLAESHAKSMIEAVISASDTADYLKVAAQDALKEFSN